MPFISKDWRSPGEEWVRYEGGWEKKKAVLTSSAAGDTNFDNFALSGCDMVLKKVHRPPVFELNRRRKHVSESVDCGNKENDEPIINNRNLLLRHVRRIRGDVGLNQDPDEDNNRNGTILLRLDALGGSSPPYCPITVRNTREVAGFNALAESLLRLDFVNAVRDIRRFHYVSQLMYLLFAHDKLSQLPGSAQKILFRMLEEMADTVYRSNANEHVFRKLMDELQTTMTIYRVWGSHLGSTQLFRQHIESRRRITEFVERMQVEYKQDLATPSGPGLVNCLPEECIREILLRLSDPSDLDRASNTCTTMKSVASEKRVWRELVQTHFTKMQVEYVLQSKPFLRETRDWRELYATLRRRYGLREEFTELIMLCRKCCALFWKSLGHPCFVVVDNNSSGSSGSEDDEESNNESNFIPVTPQTFLTFFSV